MLSLVGAGDGRLLIRAVQRGAGYAEGWELSHPVFELAKAHLQTSLTPSELSKTRVVNGNGTSATFSEFDVVVLYLLPAGLEALCPRIISSVHGQDIVGGIKQRGVRVVTQGWPIKELEVHDSCLTKGGSKLFLHLL